MNCPREHCGGLLQELEGAYKYKCTACMRYFKDVKPGEVHKERVAVKPAALAERKKILNLPAVSNGDRKDGRKAIQAHLAALDKQIIALGEKKKVLEQALLIIDEIE